MIRCSRVENLFSACWEDELSVAEREALEAHFAACAACRSAYDDFVHSLEAVQALPRLEAQPGFVEAVLARARAEERATAVRPARIRPARIWQGDWQWGWRPALAAAALAVVVGVGAYAIWSADQVPTGAPLAQSVTAPVTPQAAVPSAATEPAPARVAVASQSQARRDAGKAHAPRSSSRALGAGTALAAGSLGEEAAVPDSLFDHAYDLEFALDPVHLRRVPGEQKLRPARPMPAAEDGRKASITF
jgi:hypothetical protein